MLGDPDTPIVTGVSLVLHAEALPLIVACPGFTSSGCHTRAWGGHTSDAVFELVACVDNAPERLYQPADDEGLLDGSAHPSATADGAGGAAATGAGAAGGSLSKPRVDQSLQRMCVWPRLLALQLEQSTLRFATICCFCVVQCGC